MALVLLGGCAGDPPRTEKPKSLPTFAEKEPERYSTARELVDDLESLGVECMDWEDLGPGSQNKLLDSGNCNLEWGRLNIYILKKDHDPGWQHLFNTFNGVQGPNWIVLAPGPVEPAIVVYRALGGDPTYDNPVVEEV